MHSQRLFLDRLVTAPSSRMVACIGYRKVSPYVNYALDSTTGAAKPDGNLYIGIGHWGYLAYEQHGEVRFTVMLKVLKWLSVTPQCW